MTVTLPEIIYPELRLGYDRVSVVLGLIDNFKSEKTLIVTPANMVEQTLAGLIGSDAVHLVLKNRDVLVQNALPGIYVVAYSDLRILDGWRPFWDMVVYDETQRPEQLQEQRCARLVRPCTKVVVNFNRPPAVPGEPPRWRCRQSVKRTKAAYDRFGEDLFCVRYRYDGRGRRLTTAEVIIDRATIVSPELSEDVPSLSSLSREASRELLRKLGYAPHLSAKEKAKIVDKAEAICRILSLKEL